MAEPIDPTLAKLDVAIAAANKPDETIARLDRIIAGQPADVPRGASKVTAAAASAAPGSALDTTEAFLSGAVRGIPIVGNVLADVPDRLNAGVDVARGKAADYDAALEARRARSAGIREANPGTTFAGEVVGGVASMVPAVAAAPAMFGVRAGQTAASRIVAGGTSGAVVSGLDTLAKTGDTDKAQTAALVGAGASLAGNYVAGKLASSKFGLVPRTQTIDELETIKAAAYANMDASGVALSQRGLSRLNQELATPLQAGQFNQALHPGTNRMIATINDTAWRENGRLSISKLDELSKRLVKERSPATSATRLDLEMQDGLIERLRDFAVTLTQRDVRVGSGVTAQEASAFLREGRELAKRSFKVREMEAVIENAKLNAGTTGNVGDAINAELKKLVKNKNFAKYYSENERGVLTAMSKNSSVERLERQIARFHTYSLVGSVWRSALMGGALGAPGGPVGSGMGAGLAMATLATSAGAQVRYNAGKVDTVKRAADNLLRQQPLDAPWMRNEQTHTLGQLGAAALAREQPTDTRR